MLADHTAKVYRLYLHSQSINCRSERGLLVQIIADKPSEGARCTIVQTQLEVTRGCRRTGGGEQTHCCWN